MKREKANSNLLGLRFTGLPDRVLERLERLLRLMRLDADWTFRRPSPERRERRGSDVRRD